MSSIISHPLQIIKESIVEHVTAIFSVSDCFISEVPLHLYDSKDFLVLDLLEFFLGEFALVDGFTGLENGLGTLKRANVLGTEWRGEWAWISK